MEAVKVSYLSAKGLLPDQLRAHSTRKLATSAASDLCCSYLAYTEHSHQALCYRCSHTTEIQAGKFDFVSCDLLSTWQLPPPGRPELALLSLVWCTEIVMKIKDSDSDLRVDIYAFIPPTHLSLLSALWWVGCCGMFGRKLAGCLCLVPVDIHRRGSYCAWGKARKS